MQNLNAKTPLSHKAHGSSAVVDSVAFLTEDCLGQFCGRTSHSHSAVTKASGDPDMPLFKPKEKWAKVRPNRDVTDEMVSGWDLGLAFLP